MRLNLGCGKKKMEGFVNIDLHPDADVVHDIRDLSMYEDETAELIVALHVIEHFYCWEVQDILKEWLRVLKPGCCLLLAAPHLEKCLANILHPNKIPRMGMYGLFGDPGHADPLMMHKWAYTPKTLAFSLSEAGFENISEVQDFNSTHPRDFRLVGLKPNNG